jgi:hypothetical protein
MNTALTMQEWVETDFYEGLIKQPLWVMSAFGRLKEGEVLAKDDVRLDLIRWLVRQSIDKCPYNDRDFRADYKIADFIRIVKAVVSAHIIKNYRKNEPVLVYDKAAGIDHTDKSFSTDVGDVKCWFCNARGCDDTQNGNPIHKDCA